MNESENVVLHVHAPHKHEGEIYREGDTITVSEDVAETLLKQVFFKSCTEGNKVWSEYCPKFTKD